MRHAPILLALLVCLLAGPKAAFAADTMSVALTPPAIAIDTLYNGMDLTVSGKVPAGSQVLVRLSGEPDSFHMKQKGKVFGLLWMNLDKVTFSGAPKVFLVAASPDTPAGDISRLGVPGLAQRVTVEAKDPDKAGLVAEFLHYQKSEKLYKENAGEVALGPDAGEARPFRAVLHVPSRLSPGAYTVEVFALRDGAVTGQADSTIKASFVGAPAFLADMAFQHGALFGILASIVAILGGLIIGQLCSGSKSGAH